MICVNAAICANSTQVEKGVAGGRAVGGIYEFMAPDFLAYWHPDTNVDELPVVSCEPLSAVLASTGLHRINFFSLDAETAEL